MKIKIGSSIGGTSGSGWCQAVPHCFWLHLNPQLSSLVFTRIGGLWRLYPANREARVQLLMEGISLRRVHVTLLDTNPFLIVGNNGQEIPTTRVTVSDIPLSYNKADIEAALKKLGCQLVSPIRYECDRDNGKLTRWKTGRRFLFMGVPKEP